MNRKLRIRLWTKLAQMEAPADLPTEEVAKTKTVSGAPPTFVVSDYYPTILAFDKNAPIIQHLSDILNQALYYTSDGKVHLSWMKSNQFNIGTTAVPSADLKNLMNFAKQVYNQIYTNHGTLDKAKLKPEEIADRIEPLKTSGFISNLSSTNPMGPLSSKIGGNVKTLINNELLKIK